MTTCVLLLRLTYFIILFSFRKLPTADGLINEHVSREPNEWYLIDSSVPTGSTTANVSENCFQHTQEYLKALRSRQSWAVKMYESSGRLVEHLIHIDGSDNVHHDFGLFDECISVRSDAIDFQGQYCTVFFGLQLVENELIAEDNGTTSSENWGTPKENIFADQKPTVGFCLPSSCKVSDLRSAIRQRLGYRVIDGITFSITVLANESYCYTQEKININSTIFDTLTHVVLSAFCLLIVIVLMATVHDVWTITNVSNDSQKSFAIQLLHCFSATRNCTALLSTEEETHDSLPCLHGIRVLTFFWLVLFHFAGMSTIIPLTYNKPTIAKAAFRWEIQPLAHCTFTVDTFFLISGLLVAFAQIRHLDQTNGFFNIKRFYIRRYLRLTPVYAFVLAFIVTIFPLLGTGPNRNSVERTSQSVRNNWYAHLLYINNYVNPNQFTSRDYGFGETWYLACDMQMFWISPLLIYPIWRWKKAGIIWTIVTLLALLGISATVFIVYDLPAIFNLTRKSEISRLEEFADKYYTQTLTRMPPYIIGILLGCFLRQTTGKKIQINKVLQYLVVGGWILATLFGLLVIYGMFPYLDDTTIPIINPFIRVSYGAFHRSIWAIAVGWVIFACTYGYGGFINRFLSSTLFLPFSRLSYAIYLTHLSYVLLYLANMRKPLYVTDLLMATNYCGVLMFVFVIASFVFIFVEMPFQNLDKLLFRGNAKALKTKQP